MQSKVSAWKKAKRDGIDMTLLEVNLNKTPTERIIALQNAVFFANLLSKAGAKHYARIRSTK